MKNNNINLKLDLKSLPELLGTVLHRVSRYTVILFLLLLLGVYGFVLTKVSSLINAQPSTTAISAQAQTVAIPQIDPSTVQQIQNLQNNSVNVQTLFNQARTNPFQ
jgi:hypothetical protein